MKRISFFRCFSLLFLLAAVFMVQRAQAQLTYVTDNRSVGISVYINNVQLPGGGSYTNINYSASQTPSSPFSQFSLSVGGSVSFPSDEYGGCFAVSNVGQVTSVSPGQFQFNSDLGTAAGGLNGNNSASAYSYCQVSFNVFNPQEFNLSTVWDSQRGDIPASGSGDFQLTSVNDGVIWDSEPGPQWPYAQNSFSGTLVPGDTYSISVSMSSGLSWRDSVAESHNVELGAALTIVPEPSSIVLSALGLAGLAAIRQRRIGRKAF